MKTKLNKKRTFREHSHTAKGTTVRQGVRFDGQEVDERTDKAESGPRWKELRVWPRAR